MCCPTLAATKNATGAMAWAWLLAAGLLAIGLGFLWHTQAIFLVIGVVLVGCLAAGDPGSPGGHLRNDALIVG